MRIGIAVTCTECQRHKKPLGRDAPPNSELCSYDCPGYRSEPFPGSLWPGETEYEFGYPISDDATEESK